MKIDLTGLNHFKESVNNHKKDSKKNEIANKVANYGREIAEEKYLGVEQEVIVSTTPAVNGHSQVIARGEQIAYMEFGTGTQGKESGYPQEKLPTQSLEFISPKNRGTLQKTKGWEYNYPNQQTKKQIDGQVGWYYKKQFTTGQPAQKQMYYTSVELREKFENGGKNDV